MYSDILNKPVITGEPLPFELPEWIACAPFENYLEMNIEEVKDGRAVLSMPFKVKHAQGKGLMHGGAVTSLADTAVAMAIKSLVPENTHFVTVELELRFHAPVTGGMARALARVVDKDERRIKGEAEVFDERGLKVATFTSRFVIRKPVT